MILPHIPKRLSMIGLDDLTVNDQLSGYEPPELSPEQIARGIII